MKTPYAVTVTTSATLLVDAGARMAVSIENNEATATIYLGPDSAVTTASG